MKMSTLLEAAEGNGTIGGIEFKRGDKVRIKTKDKISSVDKIEFKVSRTYGRPPTVEMNDVNGDPSGNEYQLVYDKGYGNKPFFMLKSMSYEKVPGSGHAWLPIDPKDVKVIN